MMSCVSFPEREKGRGPAFGREPCIDDRLPLPFALAKEKMPAEWLLNSNLGYLFSYHKDGIAERKASCLNFPPLQAQPLLAGT